MYPLDLKTYLDKVSELNEEAKELKVQYQKDLEEIFLRTPYLGEISLENFSSDLSKGCVYNNHITLDIMDVINKDKNNVMLANRLTEEQKDQLKNTHKKMKEKCMDIEVRFSNIGSFSPYTHPHLLTTYHDGIFKKDLITILSNIE